MDISNSSHRLGFSLAIIIIIGVGSFYFLGSGVAEEGQPNVDGEITTNPADVTLPEEDNNLLEPNTATNGIGSFGEQNTMTNTEENIAKSVVLTTSYGEIEIELFTEKAPKTVENFVRLAESGFYSDTKFHRVIKDFMIQGGDPFSKEDSQMARWGTGGPGYQFEDEINDEKIVQGVLAMANSGPDTNGSQFFIVTAQSTPWLDGKHTAFGKVVRGMDVVEKIDNVSTGERDIPKEPVVIKSVTLK